MSSAADPTAAFFANIRASGLLQPAQLQELVSWMNVARPDNQSLAREISRRGWLTPYQIKEIFRGRGRDLVFGHYVFLDLLGEGGMGRVFKARQTRLSKEVAVKVIRREKLKHPAAEGRFYKEIQALSKMKHPNVVDVIDAGVLADTQYYEMEFIDGIDLTKMVKERGPLPIPEACEYIRQAALGLHHAYEQGLVHRDIKPSNLIVTRTNRVVKLVDLGLARLMGAEDINEEAGRITQEGYVIGTPDFLAPEQARNPMAVDIRADIYALGGTLYYILTGKVPYEGSNPTEKLLKHCTDPPPSLLQYRKDAPPAIDQIIQWCMAKEEEGRPQTPLQLALALQPFCPVVPSTYAGHPSGRFPLPGAVPASPHVQAGGSSPHVPLPPSGVYPPPGYSYPPAPPPYQPQAQPASPNAAGFPPGFPAVPAAGPSRSSQVFRLPSESRSRDPIRRRAKAKFPWGTFFLCFASLFVIGVLGYGAYEMFVRQSDPPLETFTNTQGIKMVLLEGGKFRMGAPDAELGPQHRPEESPQHEVTVRGPFFMAATEVSHSQYLKVMGVSPTKSADRAHKAQNLPVENVTWDQANDFCRKLTESEKDQKWARRGWGYRLPSEAEWEYAARAGTDTLFAFGDRIQFEKQALFQPRDKDPQKDPLAAGVPANAKRLEFPQEVGKTEPNRFGLYDMHGNVSEWCLDWYRAGYPSDSPQDNPTGPSSGDKRVIRGGSYKDPSTAVRSAWRAGMRPGEASDSVGFRVVYAPVMK